MLTHRHVAFSAAATAFRPIGLPNNRNELGFIVGLIGSVKSIIGPIAILYVSAFEDELILIRRRFKS